MSASEHKQPKETEMRSIDAQVDGEIALDSGRQASKAWEQYHIQDRGLSVRDGWDWQGAILNVSRHCLFCKMEVGYFQTDERFLYVRDIQDTLDKKACNGATLEASTF